MWPLSDLFSTFDGMFLDTNPEEDAKVLATHLLNTGKDLVTSEEAAKALGWSPRRFNPAAHNNNYSTITITTKTWSLRHWVDFLPYQEGLPVNQFNARQYCYSVGGCKK